MSLNGGMEEKVRGVKNRAAGITNAAVRQYLIAIEQVVDESEGPAVAPARHAIASLREMLSRGGEHPWHRVLDLIREMQAVIDTAKGEGVPAASRAIHALKGWVSDRTGWPRVSW